MKKTNLKSIFHKIHYLHGIIQLMEKQKNEFQGQLLLKKGNKKELNGVKKYNNLLAKEQKMEKNHLFLYFLMRNIVFLQAIGKKQNLCQKENMKKKSQ